MPNYQLWHFGQVAPGRGEEAQKDFAHRVAPSLLADGQILRASRWVRAESQLTENGFHPYEFVSLFDFIADDPSAALQHFSEVARFESWRRRVLTADSAHLFTGVGELEPAVTKPVPSGDEYVTLIMGNFTPGLEDEYHAWYDEVHAQEQLGVEGLYRVRRGRSTPLQPQPSNWQPGAVSVAIHGRYPSASAAAEAWAEFRARARGVSETGIVWAPRPPSASLIRTVHTFRALTPFELAVAQ